MLHMHISCLVKRWGRHRETGATRRHTVSTKRYSHIKTLQMSLEFDVDISTSAMHEPYPFEYTPTSPRNKRRWIQKKQDVSKSKHNFYTLLSLLLCWRQVSALMLGHPQVTRYTGLFISPSGISELDCATTNTDTAEWCISIGRESRQVFFFN